MDDFLCIGLGEDNICSLLLHTVERVAADLGLLLAPEKTEGPSTILSFLGITIDMINIECCLPEDKLRALQVEVVRMAGLKKVQFRV